jgi:DNA polymerase
VQPHVLVALGATAARAVIGKDYKVSVMRGQFVESPLAPYVFATLHPSALLRLKDEEEKEAAFQNLVKDLKLIKKALSRP